jgi:hypothetical protein
MVFYMSLILNTARISLVAQIITALCGIYGIFISLTPENMILREVLILETVVQIIELIYYIWLIQHFKYISYDVTFTRYFDWVLSTPLMLISTVVFMKYKNHASDEILTLASVILENIQPIIWFLIANWLMLLFGFFGERKLISRRNAFIGGTIMFLLSFYFVYSNFVGQHMVNHLLFWFMFIVWGLYGVAYCFQYVTKNAMYNILDIFSKNFYGLFLFFQILSLK